MKSKTTERILSKTSQETKDKVREIANEMVCEIKRTQQEKDKLEDSFAMYREEVRKLMFGEYEE